MGLHSICLSWPCAREWDYPHAVRTINTFWAGEIVQYKALCVIIDDPVIILLLLL